MQLSQYRTTFSLDLETVSELKNLAVRWSVSQAEVVRRAINMAARSDQTVHASPLEALRQYHKKHGQNKTFDKRSQNYLDEVKCNRKHWRGE